MMTLLGVDFTSAPRAAKPITCAWCVLEGGVLRLQRAVACVSFEAFALELARPGPWLGAFDLPFGLPREFVAAQGWPARWRGYTREALALSRKALVERCRAYAAPRPPGEKLAYRQTDRPAGSSSAMWWMNPPVVLMYHAGIACLLQSKVSIAPCHVRDDARVAVEAYPGLIQKRLRIKSYKQDVRAKQTPARRENRIALLTALIKNAPEMIGCKISLTRGQREAMIDDASGDALDAFLCAAQAAYAALRAPGYGFPANAPPNEGWIVMA
jgi:hypothetical protein